MIFQLATQSRFACLRMAVIALVMIASTAFTQVRAEEGTDGSALGASKKTIKTVTTTITTKVTDGEEAETEEPTEKVVTNDRVLTALFGSRGASGLSGCKTGDALTMTIKELKSDCAAWIKDRKTDLKDKFLTGSCEESCEACSMGMQRCSVSGLVHYKTK